jgi:hypothetical protein
MKKSGYVFTEGMPKGGMPAPPGNEAPDAWKPYKLWVGDLWECLGCKAQTVLGFGQNPISEHYRPEFQELCERLPPQMQVNDC